MQQHSSPRSDTCACPPCHPARPSQTLAWALNFGACFGGNATLIGASANIVTATLAERAGEKITFLTWLKAGVPVTILSVAMANVWLLLRFCL